MKPRPLRVAHVVRRYDPLLGGTERYVGDLARAQAAAGRDVTVVTLDRDVNGVRSGRLPSAEVDRGVRIIRLPGFGSPRFGLTLRPDSLIRVVRRSDVTHLHDLRFMVGTAAITARLRGRPTIFHTHGLIFGTRAFWQLKRLASWLYYEPLLRATRTHVVAGSQADATRLKRYMPGLAQSATTVVSGMDLRPFRDIERTPKAGEIAVVGRVTPIKGIDRLLRALPHVASPWSLKIHGAGEDDEPERLASLAKSLGIEDRVVFTGQFATADEPDLLATPTLGVFPSTSESLGMALVDAMAAGVPVIASDIPAHREVLQSAAPELLTDFDSPEAVGAAVDRQLRMPAAESADLTHRLRQRAAHFDVDRLVEDFDRMYGALGVGERR